MSQITHKLPKNWADEIRQAKNPEALSNLYINNLKEVLESHNKTLKTRLGIYDFEAKKRPQSAIERIPTSKSKPIQLGQKASDFAKYPTKQKLSNVFVDDAAFGSSATKIEYIRELEQLIDALKKQNAEFQKIIKEKQYQQKPTTIVVPQKYEGHDKVGNSILIGKSSLQNVSTIRKQPYETLKADNSLKDRQIQNLMEEKKLLEQEISLYKETKRTRKAKLEGFDLDKLLKKKDKSSIIYEAKQKFIVQQSQQEQKNEEIKEKYLQALMQETFLLQQQLQKLQEESKHFDPHNIV